MTRCAGVARLLVLLALMVSLLALSGCGQASTSVNLLDDLDSASSEELVEISVFFPSSDTIIEEKRSVEPDEATPLTALKIMFEEEPEDTSHTKTLPEAKVLSASIDDGTARIDFDRGVLVSGSDPGTQRVALVAIIYAMKQFPGVEQVAFSVEGKTSGQIDGKDIETFWGEVSLSDMPWSAAEPVQTTDGKE